jgi:hypothetical protein
LRKYYNQLSLSEIYDECTGLLENNKPKFIQLLEDTVDITKFIPRTFYTAFYLRNGRDRVYPLEGFISALILQKILSIPSDVLLIIFLTLSKEVREFCGFDKVPDGSKFTRFKQDFVKYIEIMFEQLVDYTEPICRKIDAALADMLIYDTSGIEAHVKENNPKFANSLIKRIKTFYKNKPEVDPYKMAYGLMPSHAEADDSIKQMYANGHFCYAHKFGVLTNGLGIVRHIAFFDEEFKENHPEVIIEKKSDSPDEDKTIGDSSSLQPVPGDFFNAHPSFHFGTFLGDSAFDKGDHYTFLKDSYRFNKVLIPINERNSGSLPPVGFNEYGYPLCPNENNLVMKYRGITRGKGRTLRIKWGCPKVLKNVCACEKPCSPAMFGRTAYTFQNQDFRKMPGIIRESDEWIEMYKKRCAVERSINHFKTNMCVGDRKSRNPSTTKADLFLAGIAQLLTVVVAHILNVPKFLRSLKQLAA